MITQVPRILSAAPTLPILPAWLLGGRAGAWKHQLIPILIPVPTRYLVTSLYYTFLPRKMRMINLCDRVVLKTKGDNKSKKVHGTLLEVRTHLVSLRMSLCLRHIQ